MQVQNRPAETLGWSVRNYAPASPRKTSAGSRCAPAAKAASGKSFTIEALLARPEWPATRDRSSAAQSGPRLPPAAAPLNFAGLALPPVQYLCSPGALHPSSYPHPGYSVYCCPPLSYAPSCRETFYAQAGTGSKVNGGLHQFKTKGGKSKRMRTSFTSEQLSRLEKEFARQQYMVGSERFLLASALQLTEAQVKVWFQNRRIKWRKQSLEQQQAKLAKLGLAAPTKSPVSQGQGDQAEDDEDFSDSDVEINVSDDSVDHC